MTNDKARLMRIRKASNKTRPSFRRFHSWRYKKLKKSGWRKQRGIDNKTRRKTKTGVVSPEPGFRGPRAVRGLHPSGLEDILVIHIKDLDNLDPKVHAIRLYSRLGSRKRIDIIDLAQEKGFRILNLGISKEDMMEFEEVDEETEDESEDEDEEE
ncbi:MAG: 50S ribosomal protein L32e [Promethearchaeota archaeon]